jgi:hypothetical protein
MYIKSVKKREKKCIYRVVRKKGSESCGKRVKKVKSLKVPVGVGVKLGAEPPVLKSLSKNS